MVSVPEYPTRIMTAAATQSCWHLAKDSSALMFIVNTISINNSGTVNNQSMYR